MYNFDKNLYDESTEKIYNFFKSIPKDSLFFKPKLKDAWSIQEHIIHFIDCEINVFMRLKNILADSGITTYENIEENWTKNIDYHKEEIDDYLIIMKYIRKVVSNLFTKIIDNKYQNNYIEHFKYGKIDLNKWIKWYTNYHFNIHKEYIERNLKYWNENAKNGM